MNPEEEIQLIHKACQGDLDAFNELVLVYQSLAYNHACWLVGDSQTAEDLTQEGLIRTYRNLNQYRGGSFRAWLLRIVGNACLDELRRQKAHQVISLNWFNDDGDEIEVDSWLEDPTASVDDILDQRELGKNLQDAIKKLPDAYRQTILLVDQMEMDYAEVAETLGIPIGTVKSRVARARLLLQKELAGTIPVAFRHMIEST